MNRYLSAEKRTSDDFDKQFTMLKGEFVYDAKTKFGPWATMNEDSFKNFGSNRLGTGYGQKYIRTADGQLHKIEG